jgi:hypothetical protein
MRKLKIPLLSFIIISLGRNGVAWTTWCLFGALVVIFKALEKPESLAAGDFCL